MILISRRVGGGVYGGGFLICGGLGISIGSGNGGCGARSAAADLSAFRLTSGFNGRRFPPPLNLDVRPHNGPPVCRSPTPSASKHLYGPDGTAVSAISLLGAPQMFTTSFKRHGGANTLENAIASVSAAMRRLATTIRPIRWERSTQHRNFAGTATHGGTGLG